jgi:ParB family chromosome partitioning protein
MAKEAERLLGGTGWLPEPLRLADAESGTQATREGETEALPAFLTDDDEAGSDADEPQSHAIAAE